MLQKQVLHFSDVYGIYFQQFRGFCVRRVVILPLPCFLFHFLFVAFHHPHRHAALYQEFRLEANLTLF